MGQFRPRVELTANPPIEQRYNGEAQLRAPWHRVAVVPAHVKRLGLWLPKKPLNPLAIFAG